MESTSTSLQLRLHVSMCTYAVLLLCMMGKVWRRMRTGQHAAELAAAAAAAILTPLD